MCIISPLSEEITADMSKMAASHLMRNASSLSTESSEFEFEFHEEAPLSPKLFFSPSHSIPTRDYFLDGESDFEAVTSHGCEENDHYTRYHFPDGESKALKNADKFQHWAERHYRYGVKSSACNPPSSHGDGFISSNYSGANSDQIGDDEAQIIDGGLNANQQELGGKSGRRSVINHTDNVSNEDSRSVLRANDDVNGGRRGTSSLRSLLNRRDFGQLPPLTNYSKQQCKEAISGFSLSTNDHSNLSPDSCSKCEDHCPDSAGVASSSPSADTTGCSRKKNRKWTFSIDFLRKSPRAVRVQCAEELRNCAASSSDTLSDDSLNHGIKPNHLDQSLISVGLHRNLREKNNCTAAATSAKEAAGDQRIDHFRAAAAASEARFNWLITENISVNYHFATGADHLAAESSRLDHNAQGQYRVGARGAETTRYHESPRHSTCSTISSSLSSSPRHGGDYEMIKTNRKKIMPMSPAGSPPRSGARNQEESTRGRPPMSPHALHYQQKKARDDELKRRTFLPYRKSLLGACFFPISTFPHRPHQAVY